MTELRAPFDGIIGLRQVSVGAYASPTTVVAKLTKVSPLKVEFAVPRTLRTRNKKRNESGLQSRRTAQRLSCTSICHRIQSGYGNSLTEHSRHLPNRNGELLPGRYADIQLKQKEIADAIAIPSEAIVPEMGKNKVFVYRNGVAEPTDVVVGIRTESEIQIVQGLAIGDTILTSGTLQLRKGMPVEIQALN